MFASDLKIELTDVKLWNSFFIEKYIKIINVKFHFYSTVNLVFSTFSEGYSKWFFLYKNWNSTLEQETLTLI